MSDCLGREEYSWGCWWARSPGLCYEELLRVAEEGRKKSLPNANKYFWLQGLVLLLSVSILVNKPLQEEGGKMDKALAHPNTWKTAGVNGEERKASRAKAGLCLCCVLRINKLFHKHYMSCPPPSKEGRGGGGSGSGGGSKEKLGLSQRRGGRSKWGGIDTCDCFSKLPCISWPVCGGGMRVCMFVPEGQWGEMQINSFISH